MADTEAALLAAILANPDDDLPRLAYADWLDEHGRPERAEFIRLEVEMARMMPDPGLAPNEWEQPSFRGLEARAGELHDRHNREWFGDLEKLADEVETRRGFPDHVALSVRKFIAHGEEIFRLAPTVRNVFLDRLGRNAPALARCKALRHVRELVFFETPFRAPEMEALARSPHLGNLRSFDIAYTDTQMGIGGAVALARAKSITALETLDVHNHAIWGVGAHVLLNARWSHALRDLHLGNNQLHDGTAEYLLLAEHLTALRHLNLMNNHLSGRDVEVLGGAAHLAGLESLCLMSNPVGDAGARAVVESPHLRRLTDLSLAGCHLTDAGCAAVVASAPEGLDRLRLSNNRVGPATAAALASARHLARLRVLELVDCRIDPEAAAVLGRVGSLPGLRLLHLDRNPLGPDGVRRLLDGPLVAPVTWLDLDRCGLGDAGVKALAKSPAVGNVRYLGLRSNGITAAGAKALAGSRHPAGLAAGSLGGNRIGKAGREALGKRFGDPECWL